MRYLSTTPQNDDLIENKKAKEIDAELVDIGSRLSDLENEVKADEQALQDYKDETSIVKAAANFDNLKVNELSQLNDVTASNIDTDKINTTDADITNADIDEATIGKLEATTGRILTLNAPQLQSTDAAITNLVTNGSATFNDVEAENVRVNGTIDINNATIENFNIENATINDTLTSDKVVANEAEIKEITSDKATVTFLETDAANLHNMQAHNIFYDGSLDATDQYYVHIEPGDEPSETAYRIIELPYFDTGDYMLSLRHPLTDMAWWSVIVHNNHNNITVSYSRRTKDNDGVEIPNPTLSEFIVYDYFGNAPKLYIKTYVGGNLYWHNHSLAPEESPRMYNEYPFDTASFGALSYKCLHDGATWFTKHLDIIRAQSANNASLFLIPSDWNNAERKQVEYNGMVDISWKYYIPNQPVNTTDEVTFRNVIINPLDGKWVYNKENALMGRNPELIGDDGQLNAHDNLIETEELVKWNGKTGTTQENHTVVAGTIFRDQGYNQTGPHIFERRDPDSYDSVAWDNKLTRNDLVAVRRKSDWAIITSNPPVVGTYEDEEQIMWTDYRYVYPDIEGGQAYEEWIERQLIDGTWVHRLLYSTIDAELYINFTRFGEDFEYGDIDYNVNSFDSYHNQITHVGDVIEGRWDAGDIHITRKTTPTESAEPDYNGSLIVDGETTLKDNVLVQNTDDDSNVGKVELHVDNYNNNAVTTNINVSTSHNVTVGTEDEPAIENHTVYGESKTEINGKADVTITGDTNIEIGTADEDTQNNVTVNSDSNVDLKGNTVITYNEMELVGHKKDAFDEDIPGSHLLIRDDVTIGQADDRHNLTVHGKLNVDSMAFVGDIGDNMRIRDIGTPTEPNIVAVAEHCAEVDEDGKLIPEDKLITAETLSQYNGTVKNSSALDPTAPDTYPIVHLGDETTVHGNIHVEGESQLDEDVTIGIDEDNQANLHVIGNANIDHKVTAHSGDIKDDLTVHGDHFVEHDLIVDKNTTIHGDLIVDGSVISTDEKTIVTSSDYAVLRQSKANGLSSTEKSGFVVHNYDGNGSSASLAVDNDGIFRVSDSATETTTSYNNMSYYNGTYYDGLSSTVATVVSGATISQDADDFSDCVNNGGTYYHYDNSLWFELSLVDSVLKYDKDDPVTDASMIATLDGLTKYDLTYYRSFTVLQIDDQNNQPLLTRSESDDLWDGAPLIWDNTENKAIAATADAPIKSKQALITRVDPETGNLTYEWGTAGSGAGAVLVLTQAEYERRAAVTDMDDEDYIPNNALVILTDADDEYLYGEVEE